ncbi:hypothetical protein J2Z31_003445 [Sinorhizobium kostiense]|uniref:DUF4169 domain-containing protein n=1 Tax=Sinorhizobium kostiense TaxID=76747 RepID=A0ABS4R1Y6_9HYPH|nr:DUF4169 family protein [Sinorhizobium kostiense]MBP2236931.1 hypothetical protein [Sinorhizobium kostiense]
MAGDVVNLRQFRKRHARAESEKQAEQNRISFGRTKAERSLTKALNEKATRSLDQGRLERGPSSAPDRNAREGKED